jgi:NADH-quinone oxidoreductase subunit E
MKLTKEQADKVNQIVDSYQAKPSALIQILLDIQREYHWLPKAALLEVSRRLEISLPRIYHVATFYKAFSVVPQGRHLISVCVGTACHVRGASQLVGKVEEILKVRPGETTEDMKFTVNTVSCLGCCALGPVMTVDSEYYSNPSSKEMEQLFSSCD